MELRNLRLIARKELRDALSNRWFLLYTASFTLLTLALARVSMMGTEMSRVSSFGRTTAGMVNLVLMLVPLIGLTTGAGSIASERERGTLSFLLSQPVSRAEILFGKYIGLWVAVSLILIFGYGVAALMMSLRGTEAWRSFVSLAIYSDLLAAAMLSIGMLISSLSGRASLATGIAVFVWLALVFLTDLGLMSSVVAFRVSVDELFYLTLANPLQAFKLSVLSGIHTSLDVLGPAGQFASRNFGGALWLVLLTPLLAWIVLPMGAAWCVLLRKSEP